MYIVKRNYLLFFIILMGLAMRIFLVVRLPIWSDERDSIYYSQLPIHTILSGTINVTHPPGYTLFLTLWSAIIHSISTFWLRLSTLLFFIVNCAFLYKLGSRYRSKLYGTMVVLAYCLSGYFVIFDWQIRPYTLLVTLILASLYIFTYPKSVLIFITFTVVNFIGLLLDYGFIWYIGSLLFVLLLSFVIPVMKKNLAGKYIYVISLCFSIVAYYAAWLAHINIGAGIDGIGWIRPMAVPSFYISYFLGAAHKQELFVLLLSVFIGAGCMWMYRTKDGFLRLPPVILAGISFCAAAVVNLFVPILHVRNLQVVGVGLLFIFAVVFEKLFVTRRYLQFFMVIFVYSVNLLLIVFAHFYTPGMLLVKF